MKQPKYSPQEALERVKLMMKYDMSKTLNENKESLKSMLNEDDDNFGEDDINTPIELSVQKLLKSCSSRPETEGTINAAAIASEFARAFNYQTIGMFSGTDDSVWKAALKNMSAGNLDDLCNVNNFYKETYDQEFAWALVQELDDEELGVLMTTFNSMKYKTDKQAKLSVTSTEQYDINWFRKTFPCIFKSDSNVDQQVLKNANNYVYILIKSKQGNLFQVFADGRVKKNDGTSTGKMISCNGSKIGFIAESLEKKKIVKEQFDEKELLGGGGTQPRPRPRPVPRPTQSQFKTCPEQMPIKFGCKNETVKEIQNCLKLTPDGMFGPKTKKALIDKGYGGESITTEMVIAICGKNDSKPSTIPSVNQAKPDEIEKVDAEDATDLLK